MIKVLTVAFVVALAAPAVAGPTKCKDDRVEKSGSTQFTIRRSGSDLTIEKRSTKAKVVSRGSKMVVEVSGSTKAEIENGKIYKSGSTWGSISDAQREFDCDGTVAASLWVLFKLGVLP
jgi:hypothetical protein